MPKRPRQHVIEDLARSQLHRAFSDIGWTVEDLDKDYGEDLLVRIFDHGRATPWSFFVQSKASDHIEQMMTNGGTVVSFPVTSEHVQHWARFWEPVVLAVYDTTSGTTYWEVVQSVFDAAQGRSGGPPAKSLVVHVPTDNLLDAQGLRRLRHRTKLRFARFEAQKEGADVLIDELKQKWGVRIEYSPEDGLLLLPKGQFVPDESGAHTFIAFGRMASSFLGMQTKHGLAPQAAFEGSLDLMRRIVAAYQSGSKLQLRDKNGAVVGEWPTLDALLRHVDREAELNDD